VVPETTVISGLDEFSMTALMLPPIKTMRLAQQPTRQGGLQPLSRFLAALQVDREDAGLVAEEPTSNPISQIP